MSAAVLAVLIGSLFSYQQLQLSGLNSRWASLKPKVMELDDLQQQIRKFRPWFDDSLPSLNILRRLTEAFPADGSVSAKSLEIHEGSAITCAGVARDNPAWLKTFDQLRKIPEIRDVQVDQLRGNKPLQFTFSFHWGEAQR